MRRTFSRKEFLALSATAGGATVLSACNLLSTKPNGQSSGTSKKGPEAPALAALVKQGKLPAVKKRLPDKPRVIQPNDSIGVYGGTWHTLLESSDTTWISTTISYDDKLVHWDPDWKKIIPHVAESFEIRQGGIEYAFTLRKGMRWSDGEPFTADDIVFWYHAILLNKELTPVIPQELQIKGKPVVVEKTDDYHVTFRFVAPHGLFLPRLATKTPFFRLFPRHYLEKFHKDTNPDVETLVKQAKAPSWSEFFLAKLDEFENVELPRLTGWLPKDPHSNGRHIRWERNPYFFCVDPDGSQLPYIDEIVFDFFAEQEALILRVVHGDVDMYTRAETTTQKNKPVFAQGRKSGGYHIVDMRTSDMNTIGICLNLTHADPVKRKLFQNKDFRIGLSYAINRPEIIDTVFLRQGKPWQTAPRPDAPFYDSDDMGTQYTEFDLDRANSALDRAGYAKKDAKGNRLDDSGRPIAISIMAQQRYSEMVDVLSLMKGTWAKVGVELRIENLDQDLVGTRIEANKYDATLDHGELGYLGMIHYDPRWLFATGGSSWAPLWSQWYEGGTPKEKPPPAMQEQIRIYRDEVIPKVELQDQYVGMKKIIEIARDEFWTMGISLPSKSYAIVKNNFHNVPDNMWLAFACPYPAASNPSQFYIKDT